LMIIIIYCTIFFKRKERPSIHYRNPALVLISVIGSTINFVLCSFLISSNAPFLPCYIQYHFRTIWITMHAVPLLIRGVQYLARMNSRLRRRFPKLKSNKHCFKAILMIFLFHSLVNNLFYFFRPKNECIPIRGYFFIAPQLIFVFLSAIAIFARISWAYDAYHIGTEMKVLVICWVVCFSIALFTKKMNLMLIFVAISTFAITVMIPVHRSFNSERNADFQSFLYKTGRELRLPTSDPRPTSEKKADPRPTSEKKAELPEHLPSDLNLSIVFSNADATEEFHKFTERHFVPEISLFLYAAHQFKQNTNESSDSMLTEYSQIISTFIATDSPYELNIHSELRQQLEDLSSNVDKFFILNNEEKLTLFDKACHEVLHLLVTNFPGFEVERCLPNSIPEARRLRPESLVCSCCCLQMAVRQKVHCAGNG